MKKTEVKITSFQSNDYRLQLLYVTKELIRGVKKTYEVRENRIIICSDVQYNKALAVYTRCIYNQLGDNNNLCFNYMPDQIQLNTYDSNGTALFYIDQEKIQALIASKLYYLTDPKRYKHVKYKLC